MPNRILQVMGNSAINWLNTGGTSVITLTSLASGAGRQGALVDLGTADRARRYAWRAWMKPGATRVVGEVVQVLWKSSDGSHPDNDDGAGDIAVSAQDKLRNLAVIGSIMIDENAAVEMVTSGEFELGHRHGCPVFWNDTSNTLSATAADFGFAMWPIEDEIQ